MFSLSRISLSILFLLAGCNYHTDKNTAFVEEIISFEAVSQAVFAPRCVGCHSGSTNDLNLTNYVSTHSRIEKINQRALVDKDMPPGAALSTQQIDVLSRWIAAGAPEGIKRPPAEKTPELPLEPKFASIRERLFVPLCISCHSPNHSAFKVPLDSKEDLLNSPRELVLPGNAKESGLIIAVTRKDRKRMPPPNSPLRKLTAEELEVIGKWIDAGAKD